MASRRQSKSARARKRAKARVKTRAAWRDEFTEQLADHREVIGSPLAHVLVLELEKFCFRTRAHLRKRILRVLQLGGRSLDI